MRCSNPTFVPYSQEQLSRPRNSWISASFQGFIVPCGHCVNCVKSRQDDFSCRLARCAAEYGNMIFVTFTYREDTIPISCRLLKVDRETGDAFSDSMSVIISDPKDGSPSILPDLRNQFASMRPSRRSRRLILQSPFPDDDLYSYYYEFTPSLDRTDFRLWLKRERVRYERDNGCKLPKFKYALIGEYGPKTCRPHMHACFMGLSYNQINDICDSWRKDFGNVWIESVKRINDDGSSGILAASRYVGKYICKGVVECDSVKDGVSQKPRFCASRNLGTDLSESELYYYSAYDLYGMYDPDRLCTMDGKFLTADQIRTIQHEVFVRAKISLDGHQFVLPRAIRDKIWKYESKIYELNGKLFTSRAGFTKDEVKSSKVVKRSLVTCKLRTMAAVASSLNFIYSDSDQLKSYIAGHPKGKIADLVSQYRSLEASITQTKETLRAFDFEAGYSCSIF